MPGYPNRRTLSFVETWDKRDINLLKEILEAAKTLPSTERMKVYLDLLPYQYPRRKPTEQAPFVLPEYLDSLPVRELETLKDGIYRRIEATITPEKREQKFREVAQLMKILEESEDDPDCRHE